MLSRAIIFIFLFASISANAGDSSYRYCLFAGYFGVNSFLGVVAQKLAVRDRVIGDTVCTATWKQGYEAGERVRAGRATAQEDQQIMLEANAFSDRVTDFIIRGAKL